MYTYPCLAQTLLAEQLDHAVSVLDLEQYHLSGLYPAIATYAQQSDDTDVNLYIRCQCVRALKPRRHPSQDDQTQKMCLMIM